VGGSWEALTGIGTLAAVVVALFIAIFHEHLRTLAWRPRLAIESSNTPPDCHRTSFGDPNAGPHVLCFYFRIRVKNCGNAPANKVEVSVEHVSERGADGTFRTKTDFQPMNLRWAHVGAPYYETIPPGLSKYCDLGHVVDPVKRGLLASERLPQRPDQPDKTLFSLDLLVKPNTGSHLLPPGTYRLELVAAAGNAKPVSRTVELNVTGNWFEDETRMLREGVGLQLLS